MQLLKEEKVEKQEIKTEIENQERIVVEVEVL